eukprot:TRINITY_DN10744_c0_g1_i1.p1 TRINITY_DN10744_c0_g1~~TRINITY_DN10744_c0_g1_i1.p1  ORF type:complete len:791 (+),score=157.88 TRINITY_DN10744_c0_g1_i1:44-2416(+)
MDPMDLDPPLPRTTTPLGELEVAKEKEKKVEMERLPFPLEMKGRVGRYFSQLTVGCGYESCDNAMCVSNRGHPSSPKLLPTKAAVVAMKLAKGSRFAWKTYTCSPSGNPPPEHLLPKEVPLLTVASLKELVEAERVSGDPSALDEVLKYFPRMTPFLFLKGFEAIDVALGDSGLDENAMREFYEILAERCTRHPYKIDRAEWAKNLLLPTNASLRRFFLLMEFPVVPVDFLFVVSRALLLLNELIGKKGLKSFTTSCEEYMKRIPLKPFTLLQERLNTFISLQIFVQDSIHDCEVIQFALSLLKIMFEVNTTRKIIPAEKFYNLILSGFIDIRMEYRRWKKIESQDEFAFCNHPYVLTPEFKAKIVNIESIISKRLQPWFHRPGINEMPYLVFNVKRDRLIRDSYDNIASIRIGNPADFKKQLKVVFEGEEGVDEGGVRKEWFQLLVSELFSVKYGMFIADDETRAHWFNQRSQDFREFELLGTVLGLAIYNNVLLNLHFPLVVYQKLADPNWSPTLEDLKDINPSLARGLQQLLDYNGDVEEDLMMNFQITYDYYGSKQTFDLVDDAFNVPVTAANREKYVKLYLEYLLIDSVKAQSDAFRTGFAVVVEGDAIKLFEPAELQLLICGSPELEFAELEKYAVYTDGYHKDHPTIVNFWNVVRKFTPEERRNLLAFTTGSDRAPIGGLGKLRFVITYQPNSHRLPTSHTCFNHLILPAYEDINTLEKLLKTAVANSTGFGPNFFSLLLLSLFLSLYELICLFHLLLCLFPVFVSLLSMLIHRNVVGLKLEN